MIPSGVVMKRLTLGSNLLITSNSQPPIRDFLQSDDLFLHLLYDLGSWLRAKAQQQESAKIYNY